MTTVAPTIRYLSGAEVEASLPPIGRQLELAEAALGALARGEAEMPPKIGVHPRPDALLHAMPAWLRTADLVGLKWVSAFPGNSGRGVPYIHGLIVLNDPETGAPTAIMDGARITAVRTAAVSAIAIARFARPGASTAAIVGAGVQARAHVPVLAGLLSGVSLRVYDRHPERAERLAAWAAGQPGVGGASAAASARDACAGADVIVTAASFGPTSQVMTADWLAPDALVVPVDFATYVSAAVVGAATRFLVDDRDQFGSYRDLGHFLDYRDPDETLGEAIARGASRAERPAGWIIATALGIGLADVVFADAVLRAAESAGRGIELPR